MRVVRQNSRRNTLIPDQMTEARIQSIVLRNLGSRTDTRLFRNQVGVGWVGGRVVRANGSVSVLYPRRVSFGLHPGSSDLIGWRTITITPDMVGKTVAVFMGVEIKSDSGSLKPHQKNWDEQLTRSGGVSLIVKGNLHPDTIEEMVRAKLP